MYSKTEYFGEKSLFHGFVPMVMGTKFDIMTTGSTEMEAFEMWHEISGILEHYGMMLNRFDVSSEVSAYNLGTRPVSDELQSLMDIAEGYRRRTGGMFDLMPRGDGKLDFGGFAKGFSLKKIASILKGYSFEGAFVDFGGSSLMALGRHPLGCDWTVTLNDPYTGIHADDFTLNDKALSVSGNTPGYESHIIDPRNGTARSGRKMTAVLASDPLDAEVLSTVLMIADGNDRKMIGNEFPDVEFHLYGFQE